MLELFSTTTETLNSLLWLLAVCAQLVGIVLVVYALIGFSRANPQSRLNGETPATYIKSLIVGSLLIVLFEVLDITSMTLVDTESRKVLDNTLLPSDDLNEQSRYMLGTVYAVVATVGFFGFVRGWWLLRSHSKPGSLTRGLVFIIAGTLAINLDAVMKITATTAAQFSHELADLIRLFTPN